MKQPSAFLPMAMSLAALALVQSHVAIFGVVHEADEGTAAQVSRFYLAVWLRDPLEPSMHAGAEQSFTRYSWSSRLSARNRLRPREYLFLISSYGSPDNSAMFLKASSRLVCFSRQNQCAMLKQLRSPCLSCSLEESRCFGILSFATCCPWSDWMILGCDGRRWLRF